MRNWIGMTLLLIGGHAGAGTPALFELLDGSRIRGEILSMEGDRYTVRTEALGTVTLSPGQIATIHLQPNSGPVQSGNPNAGLAGLDAGALANQLQAVQAMIMNDPQMLAAIRSLQNDPQFQAVLSDPQLLQAIQSGNMSALLESPEFRVLMEHRTVQDLSRQLAP